MSESQISQNNHPGPLTLTCPICLKLFSDPVSLPCGHIYCLACLQIMGEGLDQHRCPECHAVYQETNELVKNIKLGNIIEIYKATDGVNSTTELADLLVVKSDDKPHTHETKGKMEMEEPKFILASQITELGLKLEMAESVLRRDKELELEVTTANNQLREKAKTFLEQIQDLWQSYSTQVLQLIEGELTPGEEAISRRVNQASEFTKQLRQAVLTAESLLTENDEKAFSDELQSLQPCIAELMDKSVEEDNLIESKVNAARACHKLECMNAECRDEIAGIQRSLRNTLNPSEVTFDPETAHPNLILSDDLKTVTFSAVKQPYQSNSKRFTSFFQVLSTQSFQEGEHCWEVELEGSPWIIGICYSGKLPRSGLPSALESSRGSWCLMWFNNLLTAFEQSHNVPLKKTTVSCRLEIRLSFKTHRLSFYNISTISGKTHIYTFKANLTEPVHLAYRMMSGHPKARVTIHA